MASWHCHALLRERSRGRQRRFPGSPTFRAGFLPGGRRWLALALLLAGCALERDGPRFGPEPEYLGTIEDTAAPTGGISLKPAISNPITCPHCGEINRLGQTDCSRCKKRLSTRPLMEPCKLCGGTGKIDGARCADCEGRGWQEQQSAPEETR